MKPFYLATLFLLIVATAGCNQSDEIHPTGVVDHQLVGEWRCVERSENGFPTTKDLDTLFLDAQQSGGYIMLDEHSGGLEWGAEDGFINFVGFPLANRMEYIFPVVNVLTLKHCVEGDTVKYRFSRVDS